MFWFIALFTVVTGLLTLSEAYYEKAWPGEMFKYFAIGLGCLLGWAFLVGV